jgi:outer membrane protein assembly factor BamA
MAIPTLADELRQRIEPADQPAQPHIKLSRLIFRGQTTLPPSELRLIAKSLTEKSYSDSELLEELPERIRDAWQHRGYFKVVVGEPLVRQLAAPPGEQRVAVSISVDAEQLYKLGRIAYAHNTAFSYEVLRSFFPIEDGDTFDTHKLQEGIEALRKAYAVKGFINMTPIPEFDIDELHSTLTVTLELAEGKQFRLGQMTVHGMDPALAAKLLHESGLQAGAFFDFSLVRTFFERNRDILPADADPFRDTVSRYDETNGTVDLTIDVFQCSQLNELNPH